MRSGHYTAYVKTRATNNQLSDLVLHGKIQQSKLDTVMHNVKWKKNCQDKVIEKYLRHFCCFTASGIESSKGQWFHISDTHVQAVSVSKVLSAQAYLLFYERLL